MISKKSSLSEVDIPESVWLLSSPLPVPMNLIAVHCWIVTISKDTQINRWEVWQKENECRSSWGHVHKNLMYPWAGICRYPVFNCRTLWPVRIEGKVLGKKAGKMIRLIETCAPGYKFQKKYRYWPGPNSNTFIQWLIDQYPDATLKLPSSAIGKNFIV